MMLVKLALKHILPVHTTNAVIITTISLDLTIQVNFWSDKFQQIAFLDPPVTLSPGEQLQTTCLYDTSKRPNTTWGLATANEMCMDFLGYWPAQSDPKTGDEINTCSYWRDSESMSSGTICGDNGNITETSIIMQPNPKFNDTIGAPTTFGDGIETCPKPAISSPEPTSTEPSSGTSEDEGADEENSCFPASATVTLKDGSVKRMDEVLIGDDVLVDHETFSKVFMFTHKDPRVQFAFVELETFSGKKLRLTCGHFIYANGLLIEAGFVKSGDEISVTGGKTDVVVRVDRVTDVGLFNPQTLHGDIVVNGVRTSTYTRAVSAPVAHGLLVPLRFAHRWFETVVSKVL